MERTIKDEASFVNFLCVFEGEGINGKESCVTLSGKK